jgi:phosphoserine phosphatase RsbU/P
MLALETQLTASQVLRALHHDEPFLFLGAAFSTVGLVSFAFCAMRRRFDALLIWMAIFAFFYGQRLWFQSDLLSITLPHNEFLYRMRWAINFLIPIPGFFFFRIAGFMGRGGKVIVTWSSVIFLSMVTWTLAFGPRPFFDAINGALVTGVLWILVARSLNKKSVDRDSSVVRAGVLCFVAFAFWDNVVARYWLPYRVEPYGFAVLLACLGYVAARRTLDRDVELGEIHRELELARRMQLSILPAAFLILLRSRSLRSTCQ